MGYFVNNVSFKAFSFSAKESTSLLLGKQRIVTFYNNTELVAKVNLELTEWGRLEQTPIMFQQLEAINA